MTERPPRLRAISPDAAANATRPDAGIPEGELLERLTAALASLPPAERAAAIVAIGFDEGVAGVAAGQRLEPDDAEALTRNALQLLRGALADVDLDDGDLYARVRASRRTGPPHADP